MQSFDSPEKVGAIFDALTTIDKTLGYMMSREIVSANEVTDVLLDVRVLLTSVVAPPETLVPTPA